MTEDRIIPDPGDLFWTIVTTIMDWSQFNDEAAVCQAAGFPTGTRGHSVYCSFWEGTADPDDVCSVRLKNTGAFSFHDFEDALCEFGSPPAGGVDIRLVGCFVKVA
jgi:hypothetical protein